MKITWLAHASFLLEDSEGRKLLTDPYDNSIGHNIFKGDVDVVTISHHHFDHGYTEEINKSSKILDKVGLFNLCDIPIEGLPTYHDKYEGAKRGENIVYIIEMDGYRICHLGDLGHSISDDILQKIGHIDVLLIPVGGNFTIDAKEAATICKQIQSHIVIPMHYKTPKIDFPIDGVDRFITEMKNGEKVKSSSIQINGPLNGTNIVKLLDYKN